MPRAFLVHVGIVHRQGAACVGMACPQTCGQGEQGDEWAFEKVLQVRLYA
jgi:hypothetical protein